MKRPSRYMWLVPGALCAICGLVLLFDPGAMARSVCQLIGVVALIAGVAEYLNGHNAAHHHGADARTLFCIVAGAVLLFMPGLVLRSISLVAGLMLAAYSLTQILSALESRKYGARWLPQLITGGATLLVGLMMCTGGISAANVAIRLIGLALAAYGARIIFTAMPR